MASVGSVIYGSDYNAIQSLVQSVLGTGAPNGPGTASPTYGYNQTLQSAPVNAGQLITAAQWNLLVADVNSIYQHQNNTSYPGYKTYSAATLITAADYTLLYNTMSNLVSSRTTVNAAQLSATTLGTSTTATSWGAGNSGITNSSSVSFASAAAMQYFFNQGGSLRLQGIGPNLNTLQDTDWQAALAGFNYTLSLTQFTTLTGTPTVILTLNNVPSPYNNSYIQLTGSVSGGTITFVVKLQDAVPTNFDPDWGGPDSVSAGAGYTIYASTSVSAVVGTPPTPSINNTWA